jgi:hypothetical protein
MQRARRAAALLMATFLIAGLPACNSDDAKQKVDKAGNKAEKAAKEAKQKAKKAKKDAEK